MLVYLLLVIYLVILFSVVRSAPTIDKDDLVLADATPIRPLEWAKAVGLILLFVGAIALTKHLLN